MVCKQVSVGKLGKINIFPFHNRYTEFPISSGYYQREYWLCWQLPTIDMIYTWEAITSTVKFWQRECQTKNSIPSDDFLLVYLVPEIMKNPVLKRKRRKEKKIYIIISYLIFKLVLTFIYLDFRIYISFKATSFKQTFNLKVLFFFLQNHRLFLFISV